MFCFIPKSYATTLYGFSPSRSALPSVPRSTGTRGPGAFSPSACGSKHHGVLQVTSRARSRPTIDREARAFAISDSWSKSTAEMTPRFAP